MAAAVALKVEQVRVGGLLSGREALAALALMLANQLDHPHAFLPVAAVARELRATLADLEEGHDAGGDEDGWQARLDEWMHAEMGDGQES